MQVALFMSGSGTNAVKILDHQELLRRDGDAPFEASLICTDNSRSKAFSIAKRYNVPCKLQDLQRFYEDIGKNRKDLSVRSKYFEAVLEDLQDFSVDTIALSGYMAILTEPLLGAYNNRIFNIHPADLSIRNSEGKAIYTGDRAVMAAILDGQREIRATTHLVTGDVDQGPAILISAPLKVELPDGISIEELRKPENLGLAKDVADANQDRLKEVGDWVVYPLTIEFASRGYFAIGPEGVICTSDKALSIIRSKGLKIGMA